LPDSPFPTPGCAASNVFVHLHSHSSPPIQEATFQAAERGTMQRSLTRARTWPRSCGVCHFPRPLGLRCPRGSSPGSGRPTPRQRHSTFSCHSLLSRNLARQSPDVTHSTDCSRLVSIISLRLINPAKDTAAATASCQHQNSIMADLRESSPLTIRTRLGPSLPRTGSHLLD
jgi:hypothetical protein